MTTKYTNPLDNVRIASPCSQDWDAMIGTDRKRFCGECKLNVYNLSGMSRDEAENLLTNAETRLCVRFFRRADGTVLTNDCPVGWQAVKRRVSKTATAFASLFFTALGGIGAASYFAKTTAQPTTGALQPNQRNYTMGDITTDDLNSNVAVREKPFATMGNFSISQKGELVGKIAAPVPQGKTKNSRHR